VTIDMMRVLGLFFTLLYLSSSSPTISATCPSSTGKETFVTVLYKDLTNYWDYKAIAVDASCNNTCLNCNFLFTQSFNNPVGSFTWNFVPGQHYSVFLKDTARTCELSIVQYFQLYCSSISNDRFSFSWLFYGIFVTLFLVIALFLLARVINRYRQNKQQTIENTINTINTQSTGYPSYPGAIEMQEQQSSVQIFPEYPMMSSTSAQNDPLATLTPVYTQTYSQSGH